MSLSRYLSALRRGDVIDPDIIETLTGASFVPPAHGSAHPTFTYSSVSFPQYRYSYVRWIEKSICFGILRPDYDLLSTQFSGCHLAMFTKNDIRYGCHIHCAKGQCGDQREAWNQYVQTLDNQNVTIFQPDFNLWDRHKTIIMDLWGIITPDRRCYSVVVELINPDPKYPPYHFYNSRTVQRPVVKFLEMWKKTPKPATDLLIH